MIAVECPNCHRPLAELVIAGNHVSVAGQTHPENGDPGGRLTIHRSGQRQWASQVYSTDPSVAPGTASDGGRRTFTCNGRRHRLRWIVTEGALTVGYRKAEAVGRKRISVTELA